MVKQSGQPKPMPMTTAHRLAQLGVPAGFHASIEARHAPRFHVLMHIAIVLASIALAVGALALWSRYVAREGMEAAVAAHALLYDSDIGAESLGLLFAMLFAGGWLCGSITWRRGSDHARNGWAADLSHEPAKNKVATDWIWRQMIRRHTRSAHSADDFLDGLGGGMVRDLRVAFLVTLALTAALGAIFPARLSFATETEVIDRPVLPVARHTEHALANVEAVITGCPVLPSRTASLRGCHKRSDWLMRILKVTDDVERARLKALSRTGASPIALNTEEGQSPVLLSLNAFAVKMFRG